MEKLTDTELSLADLDKLFRKYNRQLIFDTVYNSFVCISYTYEDEKPARCTRRQYFRTTTDLRVEILEMMAGDIGKAIWALMK